MAAPCVSSGLAVGGRRAQSPPSLGTASQVLTVLHQLGPSAGGAETWCPGNLDTVRSVWTLWALPSVCETWDRRVARFGRPLTVSGCPSLIIPQNQRTHPERHRDDSSVTRLAPRPTEHRPTEPALRPSHAFSGPARSLPDQIHHLRPCIHPTNNATQTRLRDCMMALRLHVADAVMYALSILTLLIDSPEVQPPETGRAWAARKRWCIICDSSNLKRPSASPAACARQRFGSPCSFGHFDSCATQAPPCLPSCTSLRSRDTRTQGRGPAQAWTKTSGNRPWRRSNLYNTVVTHGVSGAVCRDHTMATAFLCPMHCAISFPIPSVWVCRQPCQIVSDPRIWKCKTPRRAEYKACSEAPMSLRRPGMHGSRPSRRPR